MNAHVACLLFFAVMDFPGFVAEFREQVKLNGKAAVVGIQAGDLVNSINGIQTEKLPLTEALRLLYGDADRLVLQLTRYINYKSPSCKLA